MLIPVDVRVISDTTFSTVEWLQSLVYEGGVLVFGDHAHPCPQRMRKTRLQSLTPQYTKNFPKSKLSQPSNFEYTSLKSPPPKPRVNSITMSRLSVVLSVFFDFLAYSGSANAQSADAKVSRTTSPSTGQYSVLLDTVFIPDSHPKSLQASAVTEIDGTLTYQLFCPTGSSPDNIACQQESKYPAIASHSPGSVFAGAFTTDADGIHTKWDCTLGSGSGDTIPKQMGVCNQTLSNRYKTSVITGRAMNSCFVVQHQIPITFTGGFEFLRVNAFATQDGEEVASDMEENVKKTCGATASRPLTTTEGITSTTPSTGGDATRTPLLPGISSSGIASANTSVARYCSELNIPWIGLCFAISLLALSLV